SPLLHKACCAHGGVAHPALDNRQAAPFVTLQSWVEMVVARNPHLKAHGAAAVAADQKSAVKATSPVAYALGSPNAIEKVLAGETRALSPAAPSARPVEMELSPAP